jgi:hypothetical protein
MYASVVDEIPEDAQRIQSTAGAFVVDEAHETGFVAGRRQSGGSKNR